MQKKINLPTDSIADTELMIEINIFVLKQVSGSNLHSLEPYL